MTTPAVRLARPNGTAGWVSSRRGRRAKPLEWVVERLIFAVSLSCIVIILLIFIFMGREALPIALGQMNSSLVGRNVIPPEEIDRLSPEELRSTSI